MDSFPAMLAPCARRFARNDLAEAALKAANLQVVTGFGPTNAPTAGTLSVMIGIIELQQLLRAPITVVISDLGAWNSRNVAWADLCHYRDRMRRFLIELGFDEQYGTIRTHLDESNLTRAGRIARYLTFADFDEHKEEFLELYGSHGLLGSGVGVLVDALYTVADILQPIERGADAVLMVSGLEESYFANLARLVLDRQAESSPGLGWTGKVGAVYFRVVRGLDGYPKMSKSIPASSIHVGLTSDEIAEKIRTEREEDQAAIMDAVDLASGWSKPDRDAALDAFRERAARPAAWRDIKERYVETFAGFARAWRETGD
jgi:tryptophanyl-tRNA synthetase